MLVGGGACVLSSFASTAALGAGRAAAAASASAAAAAAAAACRCAFGGGGVGGGEEGGGGGWRIERCSRSGAAAQFGEGIFFFFLNLACSDVRNVRVGARKLLPSPPPFLNFCPREGAGPVPARCAGHGGWG